MPEPQQKHAPLLTQTQKRRLHRTTSVLGVGSKLFWAKRLTVCLEKKDRHLHGGETAFIAECADGVEMSLETCEV